MEEDQTSEEPTEDDLLGLNGAYIQSISILHKGLNLMGEKLDKITVNPGNGATAVGRFPSFVIGASKDRKNSTKTKIDKEGDWALKPKFINGGFDFYLIPSTVTAYTEGDITPTIGGVSVFTEPPPTLPTLGSGGALYFKTNYDYHLESPFPIAAPYEPSITITSVEIVQFELDSILASPPTPIRSVSAPWNMTNDADGNSFYSLFTVYNPDASLAWAAGRYSNSSNVTAYNFGSYPQVSYGG